MTEINLMTSDQRLIAVQKVVIASGDVNSVQLKVAFDAAWDDYTARTATFYTSKDATVHESLMTDNECTVPFEVLTEACTLFIGVRGATLDGESIKTSSLVKYKIEPGAEPCKTTLSPTMDLYQQYLSALNDKVDPIRADMMAQLEAKIAEMAEKMRQHEEALADITEGEVLWTNPDTSAEFAAQTIALDLSAYKKIVVLFAGEKGTRSIILYTKGEDYEMRIHTGGGSSSTNTFARKMSWNNSGVIIGSPGSSYNAKCIPAKIIGFKSGGIKEATE